MEYQLVAVKVGHREDTAVSVQNILTEFGCHIKVRLGLHDLPDDACSPAGLIILQVSTDQKMLEDFLAKLNEVEGIVAKSLAL